ncbi:unnamed protein product [Prunus armeniaca]
MEVLWRTHGWLSSHAQAGCISLNVEMQKYLTSGPCDCSMVECDRIEVSAQKRERNTTLKDKLERVKAVVLCGRWSEEKRIFLYGVVMQQCSGHVDEDVNTISGGECHGSYIDKCYRDSIRQPSS